MQVRTLSITIVDYDPAWPRRFQHERDAIAGALRHVQISIEHVGSTSVPGLAAKPIVDIMVGVPSGAHLQPCVEPLQNLGYTYLPEYETTVPFRRFLIRRHPAPHANIHVVVQGSDFWTDQIAFRDYLRAHPAKADEYAILKRQLAKQQLDIDQYTAAKTTFVRSILVLAQQP